MIFFSFPFLNIYIIYLSCVIYCGVVDGGGRSSNLLLSIFALGLEVEKPLKCLVSSLLALDCGVEVVASLTFSLDLGLKALQCWCHMSMNNHPKGG